MGYGKKVQKEKEGKEGKITELKQQNVEMVETDGVGKN